MVPIPCVRRLYTQNGVTTTHLGQERHNRNSRVPTNHMDIDLGRLKTLDRRDKSRGPHNIERSNSKEFLGIKDAGLFQDFGKDGNSRVDGIRNDQKVGFWAVSVMAMGG